MLRVACCNLFLTAALLATPILAETPIKPPVPDGKVTGLNADSYAALQTIRKRNPGALFEADAQELVTVIRKDGKIDEGETDLLAEMTNSHFRSITITPAKTGADVADNLIVYPTSGNSKKVLQAVLNPPLDLAAEWAKPDHGWNALVKDYKSNLNREAIVQAFVAAEMAKKWEVSNMANGYKPLRDQLAKLYGLSNSTGSDTHSGRTLLYKAMIIVDRNAKDAVPDFLYNWVRPGGVM
jgi:hypothetical protein